MQCYRPHPPYHHKYLFVLFGFPALGGLVIIIAVSLFRHTAAALDVLGQHRRLDLERHRLLFTRETLLVGFRHLLIFGLAQFRMNEEL